MSRLNDVIAQAVRKALNLRKRLDIPLTHSVSAIDAAERMGIEVRIVDLPSMEGIYVAGEQPQIILSALRPQGRRMFTCAHEIGHYEFGHGDQFDELISEKKGVRQEDIREIAANTFAAYFLMPKTLIDSGMANRKLTYNSIDSVQAYGLASWLGVGYRTLISHLLFGLRSISREKANELSRVEPRMIRKKLLGDNPSAQLHVVDCHWVGRAIDGEVGDYVLLPSSTTVAGSQVVSKSIGYGLVFQASSPGIAQLANGPWHAFLRISRRRYSGRSCFRFEEEIND